MKHLRRILFEDNFLNLTLMISSDLCWTQFLLEESGLIWFLVLKKKDFKNIVQKVYPYFSTPVRQGTRFNLFDPSEIKI